ncbi:AlpA family phage regulatory protein [Duganella sp. FT135W]|uniref:AlpA family phage regulatory protein n=2 Tax=Duganella flavida TaxID=2692175 RepID=A0A6L8KA24_9BURK|nr:AlpA family phage regulatory protein [Duganella flavida]
MDTNTTIPGTCRLMRIREVLQLCGLSRATLYREIKLHAFPAPVKLSARSVGWLQDDVVLWLQTRIAQRGPAYNADTQTAHHGERKTSSVRPALRQARDESE